MSMPWNQMRLSLRFAVLGLLSLGGCQRDHPKDQNVKAPVRIGAILPLTGSGAVWGKNARQGIDLAVNEINGSGGVDGCTLEIRYEDSQTLPQHAVSALNKQIAINKVSACIVDMVSSNVLAMAPIANRHHVVLLSPGASSPRITEEGGAYVFRNWPSDALQGKLNAQFARRSIGAQKVAIFAINNEYGQGLTRVFEEEFTNSGGRVVKSETFEQGNSDFRSSLASVKAAGADLIYALSYPEEWPQILIQARELGIKTQILGTETADDPSIIVRAAQAADGLIYSVPTKPNISNERVHHFRSAFESRYGEAPGITADAAYDAVYLLVEAVKSSGNNGPGIRNHLLGVRDWPGAAGVTSFDDHGDLYRDFSYMLVRGGKPEAFKP